MNKWAVKMWGANLFLDEDGWFDSLDSDNISGVSIRRFKYWIVAFLFSFCGVMGRPAKNPKPKKYKCIVEETVEETVYMLEACGKYELARAVEEVFESK